MPDSPTTTLAGGGGGGGSGTGMTIGCAALPLTRSASRWTPSAAAAERARCVMFDTTLRVAAAISPAVQVDRPERAPRAEVDVDDHVAPSMPPSSPEPRSSPSPSSPSAARRRAAAGSRTRAGRRRRHGAAGRSSRSSGRKRRHGGGGGGAAAPPTPPPPHPPRAPPKPARRAGRRGVQRRRRRRRLCECLGPRVGRRPAASRGGGDGGGGGDVSPSAAISICTCVGVRTVLHTLRSFTATSVAKAGCVQGAPRSAPLVSPRRPPARRSRRVHR